MLAPEADGDDIAQQRNVLCADRELSPYDHRAVAFESGRRLPAGCHCDDIGQRRGNHGLIGAIVAPGTHAAVGQQDHRVAHPSGHGETRHAEFRDRTLAFVVVAPCQNPPIVADRQRMYHPRCYADCAERAYRRENRLTMIAAAPCVDSPLGVIPQRMPPTGSHRQQRMGGCSPLPIRIVAPAQYLPSSRNANGVFVPRSDGGRCPLCQLLECKRAVGAP